MVNLAGIAFCPVLDETQVEVALVIQLAAQAHLGIQAAGRDERGQRCSRFARILRHQALHRLQDPVGGLLHCWLELVVHVFVDIAHQAPKLEIAGHPGAANGHDYSLVDSTLTGLSTFSVTSSA
ncbi:hypothetical protein D3C77_396660 [compost metagenome]